MRQAAHAKVDTYGYVQGVEGVAGAPTFQKAGRATEGQAFFLLMEAAYRDCAEENNLATRRWESPMEHESV
jgi:hypothetical protein